MDRFSPPQLKWESQDLGREYQDFKQRCELVFAVPMKGTPPADQLAYVLLWGGSKTMDLYNTWSEADKTLAKFWSVLKQAIEPSENFRLARFNLVGILQNADEDIEACVLRLRKAAASCVRDNRHHTGPDCRAVDPRMQTFFCAGHPPVQRCIPHPRRSPDYCSNLRSQSTTGEKPTCFPNKQHTNVILPMRRQALSTLTAYVCKPATAIQQPLRYQWQYHML